MILFKQRQLKKRLFNEWQKNRETNEIRYISRCDGCLILYDYQQRVFRKHFFYDGYEEKLEFFKIMNEIGRTKCYDFL